MSIFITNNLLDLTTKTKQNSSVSIRNNGLNFNYCKLELIDCLIMKKSWSISEIIQLVKLY